MKLALLLVLLVAACDAPDPTYADYASRRRDAVCDRLARCGLIPDRATCDAINLGPHGTPDPNWVALVEEGRVRWHPEHVDACLDEIAGRTCEHVGQSPALLACAALFSGTLPDGARCTWSAECISQECWTEGCTDACCVSTCVGNVAPVPAKLGEACRYAPCAEGRCDNSAFCVPYKQEGEACNYLECDVGLECVGSRCVRLPRTGEACSTRCALAGDVCGTDYRCTPAGTPGAPCFDDDHCAFYLECNLTTYVCQASTRGIGSACAATLECAEPGSVCLTATERCAWPQPDGAACHAAAECASAFCEHTPNMASGTCAARSSCW